MSIATALTALADDVSAAKAAITAKGGTAPNGTADMADAIAAIPTGGIESGLEILETNSLYQYKRVRQIGEFLPAHAFSYMGTVLTELIIDENLKYIGASAFYNGGFASLTDLTFPNVVSVGGGAFGITNLNIRKLEFPKLQSVTARYVFELKTIEDIIVGSVGYPVNNIEGNAFYLKSDTITLTIYTTGDYTDTAITRIRNYSPLIKIVIKAAENTTYGGETYLAGETILTSEVA